MNLYERTLYKREKNVRRRVEIDETLYKKLVEYSKIYDASINKLLNIAIVELTKTEKVDIYQRPLNEKRGTHNFVVRESVYNELLKLKRKYGLSVFKLVNIAIYNAFND